MADFKGRLSYIDPNELAKYEGFHFADGRGDNVSWNPEDLNISVDLQVIIPDRDSCGKDIANDVYVQLQSKDEKFNSFMRGHDLQPGENFLTDDYTNISFQEIRENGCGGRESLGIKSIDINFDSHFYPRVTINMTDVRGYSLMQPAEERYREQLKGSKNACEIFFSALFHFPYPQFALSVKGYYGDRVTYLLAVTDTNFKFNSQTGNFDVKIDFMGHMYGVYADLPLNYILLAPYFGSNGRNPNEYWEGQVQQGNFVFNNGKRIPTLIQFIKEYERMAENYEMRKMRGESSDIVTIVNEIGKIEGELNGAKEAYLNYITSLMPVSSGVSMVESDKHLFFFTSASEIVFAQNVQDKFNELKKSLDTPNIHKMHIEIGEEEEWLGSDEKWVSGNTRKQSTKEQKEYPEIAEISVPEDNKNDNVFVCKSHADILQKIEVALQSVRDSKERRINDSASEIAELSQEILGIHPTIENVFRMLFAHIDTFMHYFYSTLDNIKKSNRKIKGSGISLSETDIRAKDSENCFIPPFPGLFVDDKKGNKRVKKYPGDMAKYAKILKPELNLVNLICKSLQSSANYDGFFEDNYRALEQQAEEAAIDEEQNSLKVWEHLSWLDDYLDVNPYACFANVSVEDIDDIIYYFICRIYVAWYAKTNITNEKVISEYNNLMRVCGNFLKHDPDDTLRNIYQTWLSNIDESLCNYLEKHITTGTAKGYCVLPDGLKYFNDFIRPVEFYDDAYGRNYRFPVNGIVVFDSVKNPTIKKEINPKDKKKYRKKKAVGKFMFVDVIKAFIKKLEESIGYDTNEYLDANSPTEDNTVSFSNDIKNTTRQDIYYRLKDLYDKWLSGYDVKRFKLRSPQEDRKNADAKYRGTEVRNDITEFENFVFIDNFFNDIRDKLIVDTERLHDILIEDTDYSKEKSLLQFIGDLAYESRVNFVTLPVYNNVYNGEALARVFKPQGLYDGQGCNARGIGNTHVLIYNHEPSYKSGTPSGENSTGYDSDYWYIADNCGEISIEGLDDFDSNSGDNAYHMPVFGVTFAKQNQMYFKSIDLDTSSNKMTDYAIANQLNLAQQAAKSGDRINSITMGQNVYSIYSNRQYECTVEMMGCSNIMPLMFFQLNNIPAFKGVYRIYSVSHHIENNTMTTRFVGTRAPKYAIPFNETVIDIDSLVAAVSELETDGETIFGGFGDNDGGDYAGGGVGEMNSGSRTDVCAAEEVTATTIHHDDVLDFSKCLKKVESEFVCNKKNAHPSKPGSKGVCACAVKEILKAGFGTASQLYTKLNDWANGYNVKDKLPGVGFKPVFCIPAGTPPEDIRNILGGKGDKYKPKPGDVAAIHPVPGHKYGHAQIYTGKDKYGWVSDFKQNSGWIYGRAKSRGIIVFEYTGPILYPKSLAIQWANKGITKFSIEGEDRAEEHIDVLVEVNEKEMVSAGGTVILENAPETVKLTINFPTNVKAKKYNVIYEWVQKPQKNQDNADGKTLPKPNIDNDGNVKTLTWTGLKNADSTLIFYIEKAEKE